MEKPKKITVHDGILMFTSREVEFLFLDTSTSMSLITEIFSDNYKVFEKCVNFNDGDFVVDLGANEGMFSIMIAKMFPGVRVVAVEPVPRTFETLERNIELNKLENVTALNIGVGSERHTNEMIVDNIYSGGSSSYIAYDPKRHTKVNARIVPINTMLEVLCLQYIKLMKVDIEGAEYDALYNIDFKTFFIENMVAELHMNRRLDTNGRRIDALETWLSGRTNLLHVDRCIMSE